MALDREHFTRCALTALACLFANAALAADISFTGQFSKDDDVQLFQFSLANETIVSMQTWSFAGGLNVAGSIIPGGGFAPALSLFDASGSQDLLGLDTGGFPPSNCGPRNIDSGFCLDAYMVVDLFPGMYILVLTQSDNLPMGPTLADGFFYQGAGNYTGDLYGVPGGSFILFDGTSRTNQWAVDITGVDYAGMVPEPCSALFGALGLIALSAGGWWRKRRLNH
jgi:hypothetical protein